ncbi:MAG: hypothetical protein R2734_03130 [Nocardioides sp.]
MSEARRGPARLRRLRHVGRLPLYWPLLEPAGAGEILTHRPCGPRWSPPPWSC